MNKKVIPKLAGLNAAIAAADVAIFSGGLLNLGTGPIGWVIGIASAAAFCVGNYMLLTSDSAKLGYKVDKLKDPDDYIDALESWRGRELPFEGEITCGIKQLEQLERKKNALFAVSGDEKDGAFTSVAAEVETAVLTNVKRILNRFMIFDKQDTDKLYMHKNYIQGLLENNSKVLAEFDSLIIEVSQIGDIAETQSLNLDYITNSLRQLRTEGDALEQNKFKLQ